MSGNTITHQVTPTVARTTRKRETPLTQSGAARELGLKRSEFDLAVHLGHIRTLPDEGGGGPRVARAEIERLRAQEDFPAALQKRVAAVGTREATEIMEISAARFTRLSRLGLVVPVKFYFNRYRAVVWLYLADELRSFAAGTENTSLLNRPLPEVLRTQLDAGVDLRPRNWRGRHLGFLLRQADGPWERAAAVASLLDPVQVSEIVKDPYERAHVNRFRPRPSAHGAPGTPAAHLTERIMTAQDPDEIDWLRADLARAVEEARTHRPAPRPAPGRTDDRPVQEPRPRVPWQPTGRDRPQQPDRPDRPDRPEQPQGSERPRGLLGRFLHRGA
ncbi:DUF6397 family protein [Streptomyces sp. Li-HN-5-11]|uniref:DUF6397 family protein n=1 Tax=Streptomyces sp. Li-HN-5-11 TaxID=3075432 RepID=UPI0028AB5322|nr:DUF6397 family protein [Streptomyces sp. Li-HN-5-11]WNM33388.1 DUF6397 family protein [Streptomyces sp. Li-HN-5-11]